MDLAICFYFIPFGRNNGKHRQCNQRTDKN